MIISVDYERKKKGCLIYETLSTLRGLPGARSEISGPNVYKISGHFQNIFVGFTRFKTQKMHVFLSSLCYSLKQISIAVLKMLLRYCYEHTKAKL